MATTRRITSVLTVAFVAMGILGLATGPAGAASITVVNGDFQAPYTGTWTVVPGWVAGHPCYYGNNKNGGLLYLDAGGWASQNLSYNWTAGEVFTLGIRGNQGWQTGGTFKIRLREADGTVLWDSGTISVDSTWQDFSWTIDSSTDFLAGTPGSQLQIRMDCLNATVYLDDVTLSTDLEDTIPPTLAGSDIVDNKSGGPVNPGEVITYTVTFSEAMDSGTVSAGDFDNAGTAAVLIGTPTTTAGVIWQIRVVASSTGTLRLRVPVGASMTDLAGNPLDTSSAILDDTAINVVAKAIGVTGGDFEVPALPALAQPGDIPFWFDNTAAYADWHNSSGYTSNGSQSAFLHFFGGARGYMYQSLGQLAAGTKSLDWSFDQVRYTLGLTSNSTADMRFFHGVSLAPGDGVDIDTLGFTQIGSTISIPAVSDSDASRSGSVDVSSVPAGSTVWVDFTHTGSGNFLLDNVAVTEIRPAGTVVLIR